MSNIFTQRRAEHDAARVQKLTPPRSAAETEQRENARIIFESYRDANAIHRAAIRAQFGNLIELGRRVAEETTEPPEGPKAA